MFVYALMGFITPCVGKHIYKYILYAAHNAEQWPFASFLDRASLESCILFVCLLRKRIELSDCESFRPDAWSGSASERFCYSNARRKPR